MCCLFFLQVCYTLLLDFLGVGEGPFSSSVASPWSSCSLLCVSCGSFYPFVNPFQGMRVVEPVPPLLPVAASIAPTLVPWWSPGWSSSLYGPKEPGVLVTPPGWCLLEADESPAWLFLLGVPQDMLDTLWVPLGLSPLRLCNSVLYTSSQSLRREVCVGCYKCHLRLQELHLEWAELSSRFHKTSIRPCYIRRVT